MYTLDPQLSGVHLDSASVLAGQPTDPGFLAALAVAVTLMLAGFAVEALFGLFVQGFRLLFRRQR
jgi:hypothetical protein